jgi:glycosyltransferase involved in cell wall biosynthesis
VVISVDRRSFPFDSRKVRAIGHGIDVAEFPCAGPVPPGETLRALVLGRYSPAKGLETIVRAAALAGVRVEMHGTDAEFEEYKRGLERLVRDVGADVNLGGPVPRADIPALLARSDVLINNMRAGAPDKVVYEAAASCLPVLASNPVLDDLLPEELRFDRDDAAMLAERLRTLDRRRRPELREVVLARHSVDHWADGVLATVEPR